MQSRSLFVLLAMAVGAGAFMVPSIFAPQSCSLVDSSIVRTRASEIVMGVHRNDQQKRRRTSLLRHVNAPLHQRRVIMSSPLSKELREQYGGVRSIPIRTGDEIVVTAGDHRKKTGKVIGVDRKKYYIHIEGITREKAGAKEAGKTSTTIPVPIRASKVRITKLYLDKSREQILARKMEGRKELAQKGAERKLVPATEDADFQAYQKKLASILDGSA
uniref:Plastid ribosomal protein L26 n=1 Tax=Pseudellipsoidion edaphicum TaxID=1431838 RepID=A0A3R5U8K0_9STRA|nr:plastid ribosomal protein L26 [Pseudellipsoidion edaphicum]